MPDGLPDVIGGVGALVETPLFFPSFSGRLNLQLLAEAAGVAADRVEECLETGRPRATAPTTGSRATRSA